jgi:hypothetical protein
MISPLKYFATGGAPGFVVDAVGSRSKVRQHKRFDACFLGDAADIFGGCVVRLALGLKSANGLKLKWPAVLLVECS